MDEIKKESEGEGEGKRLIDAVVLIIDVIIVTSFSFTKL